MTKTKQDYFDYLDRIRDTENLRDEDIGPRLRARFCLTIDESRLIKTEWLDGYWRRYVN